MRQGISVVIPVYGSEKTIAPLCEELKQLFQNELSDTEYEIILVNDCSPDHVAAVLSQIAMANPRIRVYTFIRNFGQHNATLFGIRQANYSITITMDDDGQHNPADIPHLVNTLRKSKERIVYAYPQEENRGAFRSWASRFIKLCMNRLLGVRGATSIASFRCFDTRLRDMFADYSGSDVFIDALLSWGGPSISIPTQLRNRQEGESGYTLRKLIRHSMNLVTSFSIVPLRFACLCGLVLTFLGLILLLIVGVRFFYVGREAPGFILLFSSLVTFSGIQLLTLGVFGEYIGRMYMRQMHRPQYVLSSSNNQGKDVPDEQDI